MMKSSRKIKRKEKRQQEETTELPEALSNISLPRNIDLESFFQARMLELDHFLTILNSKLNTTGRTSNKKSFQLLPKHMRRRAMSHNSYRVPARVRLSGQSSAKLKNPCRKARRHSSKLIQKYQRKSNKNKWLETHIWHAKRMKMKSLWGYKLAMHTNDKGIRASYRFMKNSSVLYDSSYYTGILIFEYDFCQRILGVGNSEYLRNYAYLFDGNELICPIEAFHAPNGTMIVIHPASLEQVVEFLNKNSIKFLCIKDQLAIYKLRGPKSTDIIKNSCDINEQEAKSLIESLSLFHNFKLPDGALVSFSAMKKLFKPKSFLWKRLEASQGIVPEQPSPELLQLMISWGDSFYSPEFWSQFTSSENISLVPEKITTRTSKSRYPDSKLLEKKNEDKKKIKETATDILMNEDILKEDVEVEETNKDDYTIITGKYKEQESKMELDEVQENLSKNILLVYSHDKYGDGWDIILKSQDTSWLWRNFVYAGAKAIGLSEMKSIYLEQGKLFFPDDFPTTKAYSHLALDTAKEKIENYMKRPSSKRMNYEKINSPYPFFSDWTCGLQSIVKYKDLTPVQIKCKKRCPKPLAYLCIPDPEDLLQHKESLAVPKVKNSQLTLENIDDWKNLTPSRKIIGFITSGGFCFSKSKGYGIGYILSIFEEFVGKKILFRNVISQYYHICYLNHLKN